MTKWTELEEKTLMNARNEGLTFKQISENFTVYDGFSERTESACRAKYKQLVSLNAAETTYNSVEEKPLEATEGIDGDTDIGALMSRRESRKMRKLMLRVAIAQANLDAFSEKILNRNSINRGD